MRLLRQEARSIAVRMLHNELSRGATRSLRDVAPWAWIAIEPLLRRLPQPVQTIRVPGVEKGPPRLLVDVSTTARVTVLSGIQRVVRSLAGALQRERADYPLQPLPVRLVRGERREWVLVAAPGFPTDPAGRNAIALRQGDTLLMLDSTWDFYPSFVQAVFPVVRSQGGQVLTCIYDILPVTHPEFFIKRTVDMFVPWFHAAVAESDGLIAISQATLEETRRVVAVRNVTCPALDFFHLGADFHEPIAPPIQAPTSQYPPLFLMVGTIEPRKGHATVLDAFELLWSRGLPMRLAIVGRQGWKVRALLRRMRRLARREKRFFFYDNADDATLIGLYDAASAVIAASIAEGFGLPLVEALMRGKSLIVSDIPAFREVAGRGPKFFQAGNAESLAETIERFLSEPCAQPTPVKHWLTWDQSADMLMERVCRIRSSAR